MTDPMQTFWEAAHAARDAREKAKQQRRQRIRGSYKLGLCVFCGSPDHTGSCPQREDAQARAERIRRWHEYHSVDSRSESNLSPTSGERKV